MNRDDWVFVGVRLVGLYLLVAAILDLPAVLLATRVPVGDEPVLAGPMLTMGLSAMMGVTLMMGAPVLVAWLAKKDATV